MIYYILQVVTTSNCRAFFSVPLGSGFVAHYATQHQQNRQHLSLVTPTTTLPTHLLDCVGCDVNSVDFRVVVAKVQRLMRRYQSQ